jgi:RNA polymerase sigma factor (sigma-70 family)
MKDDSLLRRCQQGDNAAFKELYGLYSKAMLNISVRIVNNVNEAEDILQESFLKAFQQIKTFDKEAAFAGWLKRVIINRSIDVVRKQKELFVSLDKTDVAEREEEDNEVAYNVQTVKQCINELPDGFRVVLCLYLFEDYGHKEIASMLGISEGTSKSQYNRAKKKLIQLVKQKNVIHEH